MPPLTGLPVEILAPILRFANLNGDLPQLRLSCAHLNALIWKERELYAQDICCLYGISRRDMTLYHDGHENKESFGELRYYLFFRREVAIFEALNSHLTRTCTTVLAKSGLTPFLLFSAFSQMTKNTEAETSVQRVVNTRQILQHRLNSNWKLSELEHLISAINFCSSELWNILPHLELGACTKGNHESSTRAVSATQRGLVTEIVIRKGPKWAAQVLLGAMRQDTLGKLQVESSAQMLTTGDLKAMPDQSGAIIVSEGLARMLWRERTAQIERDTRRMEAERRGKLNISDLRVNAAVWRGSAGDM